MSLASLRSAPASPHGPRRDRVREKFAGWGRAARDHLDVLEHLYAVAFVTAILSIAAGFALDRSGLRLPAWLNPGLSFLVAAVVSGVGYWSARTQRRERLREVAAAATRLLDWDLGVGALPHLEGQRVTIRSLARAAREDRLTDELNLASGGYSLAGRLEESCDEFERATAHHAGRLAPPRANAHVQQVIRSLRATADEVTRYEGRVQELLGGNLRYDRTARRVTLAPAIDALAKPLLAAAGAAEALDNLANPREALAATVRRDREAEAARRARLDLHAAAQSAAAELLLDAKPADLERSTLRRADGSLRDVARLDKFAFDDEVEETALAAWRARVDAVHGPMVAAVQGRGLEMHQATHRSWVEANNAASDVSRAITYLESGLRTNTTLDEETRTSAAVRERVDRDRSEVLAAVRNLVQRVDELLELEVQ